MVSMSSKPLLSGYFKRRKHLASRYHNSYSKMNHHTLEPLKKNTKKKKKRERERGKK